MVESPPLVNIIFIYLCQTSLDIFNTILFDGSTIIIIGHRAKCIWIDSSDYDIRIGLSTDMKIDLESSNTTSLIVQQNAFKYSINGGITYQFPQDDIHIFRIHLPNINDRITPNIITSIPQQIGECNDLKLFPRSTLNSGGKYD